MSHTAGESSSRRQQK